MMNVAFSSAIKFYIKKQGYNEDDKACTSTAVTYQEFFNNPSFPDTLVAAVAHAISV